MHCENEDFLGSGHARDIGSEAMKANLSTNVARPTAAWFAESLRFASL
jgi:hypothetical protein